MKTLYTFLCVVIFTGHVHGQTGKMAKPWRFGVSAGSPVVGKIYDSGKMKPASGLVVAADLGYYFEDRKSGPSLHFQPGFTTFKKTETYGKEDGRYFIESKWKWEAIHLPLSFRYTLSTGAVRPFVEFGFNFRFRTALFVRRSGTICGVVSCNAVGGSQSIQNVANKDKAGILAGVGVEIDAGKFIIPLSLQLVDSFIKPKVSGDLGLTRVPSDLRTKFVQVTAGVSIH
ncbi:hypothetical protein [Dyadobacter sp. BHUBP1]|uniref:hypothetical protein n=1 Tax=Dyadobacter sp. BHUBP1 TaxID=3424178 RepID=UPI003D34E0B3